MTLRNSGRSWNQTCQPGTMDRQDFCGWKTPVWKPCQFMALTTTSVFASIQGTQSQISQVFLLHVISIYRVWEKFPAINTRILRDHAGFGLLTKSNDEPEVMQILAVGGSSPETRDPLKMVESWDNVRCVMICHLICII